MGVAGGRWVSSNRGAGGPKMEVEVEEEVEEEVEVEL